MTEPRQRVWAPGSKGQAVLCSRERLCDPAVAHTEMRTPCSAEETLDRAGVQVSPRREGRQYPKHAGRKEARGCRVALGTQPEKTGPRANLASSFLTVSRVCLSEITEKTFAGGKYLSQFLML